MSEEREGEVAATSPPPSHFQAADDAGQNVGSSGVAYTQDEQPLNSTSTQSTQQHGAFDAPSHDDAQTSAISASVSERDVEALTAVQDRHEQDSDNVAAFTSGSASSASQVAGAPAKKFTSLNVNKRFLGKAAPAPAAVSPAILKLGTSVSPLPSHRLSSPSATSRLTSAKLSSVPKPQPAGWATSKPATPIAKPTPTSQPSAASEPSPASVPTSDVASPATAATSTDPLPAEAAVNQGRATQSPRPANLPASQISVSSAGPSAGAAASPRLVSMGRDSPRPGSAGLDSGSGHGRASPGLRNAALGSSLRAPSPANVSRAPWAGVKSSLSPNPTSTRVRTLSDFPTAAEAAQAKQEQEEKAAAAIAREAARQQAALQALDRFRGASLGSGKHWDEMEDEDGGFLGEVVEFGDGTQYKIPTSNDGSRGNQDDGPPVSKDERFKDVSHDRRWPQRNLARPDTAALTDRARPAAGQPPAWGPMKNREMATPSTSEPAQPVSRPSRSEQRAEKVIIPTTGASVSLRSPVESRDSMPAFSYGRERRAGPGAMPYGGRQDQGGAPQAAQAVPTQAARTWGPLAQRQASLNPGTTPASAPKPAPAAESSAQHATPVSAPIVTEPVRTTAPFPPSQQQQQQQDVSRAAPQLNRERNAGPAKEHAPSVTSSTNGRPLPPHLLVAGSGESHASAQTSRPLPPHLAQNLRPAATQSTENEGRKTSHDHEEVRRPSEPATQTASSSAANEQAAYQTQSKPHANGGGQGKAPWGPKATAQDMSYAALESPDSQHRAQPAADRFAAGPQEDVHASIERARKRREEEEQARLAEKERARQKALAIEERIRAAEQQREVEAHRAAERRAAEAASAASAAAEGPALKKTGPADTAASWRTARPERAAADIGLTRPRQSQGAGMPTETDVAPSATSSLEQTRNGRVLSSQHRSEPKDERFAVRRDQREQYVAQIRDQYRQRGANAHDMSAPSGLSYGDGQAPPADLGLRAGAVEAPKIILARPAKAPPTARASETRANQVSAAQNGNVVSMPRRNLPSAAERPTTKPSAGKPRESSAPGRSPQTSPPEVTEAAEPILAPAPVRLYPVVRKEAVETRPETAQDAPPAWNRFVVQLKGSRPRPKLNRYQQKQLFARLAAMKAPGRAVYPLTWDPPLAHLSIKTLSRDDQLFPKRFHRGTVIAPVKLPTRILPRGLPSIVSQIASQGSGLGARKQARFDLTPYWSERQGASSFGDGSAIDAQASSLSPASQIQVRLPGHHATVIQPHGSDALQAGAPLSGRRSQNFDSTTDAIIGEALLSGAPQSAYDARSRSARNAPAATAAPGSLGPLDYPQNGYPADAFDPHTPAGGYRVKGRAGPNNAAVAFYEERQVNTPSPVSFMVNSEIKADAGGARGSLSPFAIPGSTRASQAQTPASGGSMLPSPSMSTQGTWGQSSLTFPVLETRSSNLADRDHIKSVWSLATNSHAGETQNSLKDIGDDFMPSTLPMSVLDFRADDGRVRAQRDEGDSWASSTLNRYQQYGRSQHDVNSNSRDLSPVASRSNGFDPTSRSPALGMDASAAAAAAARARETGQHYTGASQQGSNAYSSLNGGTYGHHQASSYSPRERQQDAGNGMGQSAFGAYGGYGSNASSNNVSSMTTDALYAMTSYDRGSMTPNRQSYAQYGSHGTSARSAPGSPYSGIRGHTNNLTNVPSYSLFPTGGTSASQTAKMDGLGVLDDGARTQFYSSRTYQADSSPKWPTSTSTGSVLRPAASVFNPSKFSASRAQPQQVHHHQQQQEDEYDPTAGASAGPIDQYAGAASSGYGTNAGYGAFSSGAGLW